MILFFDTSALFKCFHREEGSENVIGLLESTTDPKQLQETLTQFEYATVDYVIEPINTEVIFEAISLIKDYAQTISLRSLDGIQLATFSLIQELGWAFVTTDTKLATAATQMGFEVINPILIG